ncbi:uncharacterized protein [Venturia canescens]|uniref:uncharacterized protein n=1 Tax=Venturia canescens TaxID=32260 RepID=UPI001C9C03FF|nr:uncharacterized protein LOC122417533 [Venturia canescens]
MNDIFHPSYYKISELGCKDDGKITTAFHVYIELCEERKFWDIHYKYHEDLDLIYLEARIRENSEIEIYIPWAANNNITLRNIENIQEQLQCTSFTLVLKSSDSSSIFYKVTEGLAKPPTPQMTKDLKSRNEKKAELERAIRNNARNLHELAKSQLIDGEGDN